MIANIFKKTVTPKNGNKPFTKLITTLTDKEGNKIYCDVHFTDDCKPHYFPCTIEFTKGQANISTKTIHRGQDNEYTVNNLWVNDCVAREFEDHSLDDFDF